MAEKRRNRRNPSARRGLAYSLMILAAAAVLIWLMSGGGGKTASKETPSVVDSASKDKGSPGDEGVQAPQEVDNTEDGGRKKGQVKKVIKIGQTQVVGSESLDFSTEQQKPGLMWLPIGLHEVSSGDPWVAMCLIDYGHYQENPSATPMYTFLNNHSKCGTKKPAGGKEGVGMGSVELVRMSSLMRSMKETNRSPIPPKGFVYHETRCGSTLVANMLASLPPSRVFSESKPPTQTIRECYAEGCSRDMMISIFRNVVALMGRRREGEQHEHLYYKFQNSKFIPEISEAFPEVPWIFVFRDPVEVMVSNLKSFSGAPCVRIPRQEKMRKDGGGQGWGKKMALPNFGPRGKANVPGGQLSGRARLPPGKRWLREGGDDGEVSPGIDGTVSYAATEAVAEVGKYMPEEELSSFATVSWNGFGGSGVWDEHYNFNLTTGFQEGSEMALLSRRWGGGRGNEGRWLMEKRLTKQLKLTMNMTMECADWLQSLCVSAVDGGRDFPRKALFVDYANLPDAVPEYVFPKHFDMAREVDKTVPDWEERMWKAAGSYSKGGGKTGRVFAGDIEAKHKQASPLIVEASGLKGGLYDLYHTLDGMQTWRRPNTTDDSE